jgi:hypothetical protein
MSMVVDSRWTFEIVTTNKFMNRYRQEHTSGDFSVSPWLGASWGFSNEALVGPG